MQVSLYFFCLWPLGQVNEGKACPCKWSSPSLCLKHLTSLHPCSCPKVWMLDFIETLSFLTGPLFCLHFPPSKRGFSALELFDKSSFQNFLAGACIPYWVPAAPFPTQLLANGPGRAENGSSAWASVPTLGTQRKLLVLYHPTSLAVEAFWGVYQWREDFSLCLS